MNLEIDGLDPHPPAFRATSLATARLRTEPRTPAASDPARSPVGDPADPLHAARALEIARRTRLVRAAKLRAFRRHGRLELTDEELDAVLPDDGARYAFALETARAGKALDGETVARVRELIAAGVSRREVGRRLGIDRYAVGIIARGGSRVGGAASGTKDTKGIT